MGKASLVKFKVDKHSHLHLYWLIKDIHNDLTTHNYLNQEGAKNWKIEYKPIIMGNNCAYPERVEAFKKSILRGDILKPIVVYDASNVIDGRHKLAAYRELEIKQIPVASASHNGQGEIKDNIYEPLLNKINTFKNRPKYKLCLSCGNNLKRNGDKLKCFTCNREVIANDLLGWGVPNL